MALCDLHARSVRTWIPRDTPELTPVLPSQVLLLDHQLFQSCSTVPRCVVRAASSLDCETVLMRTFFIQVRQREQWHRRFLRSFPD